MAKSNKTWNTDCRTCFNATNKKWNSLTTKTRDYKKRLKSFGELLEEITEIKSKDDKYPELPTFICVNCSRRLKSAHTFIQQAKEVNAKLYSMLNKKLDCLQETQIDLETWIEIKVENLEQEDKKENLNCWQEAQNDLGAYTEIKIENKKQLLLKEEKLNCLQEVEIDIEADTEIKVEDDKHKNKFQEIAYKDIEQVKEKNFCKLQTTRDSKKPIDSSNNDSESESLLSNDCEWEETKKLIKPKATFSTENKELTDIAVPCNKCNKIFKNSKLLAVHQRISHIPEEKKCTCHLCGNKFTRYCNMYKHMRMFHGPETVTLISKRPEDDYIYKCDLCPKKYSRKKSLVYHRKLKHSSSPTTEIKENKTNTERKKEKSVTDKGSLCPICGSSFTSKNQLTVHLRRHTGERPFRCDLCDRAFLLVTQLNSHKRVHTGEKPYKCQVCGKAFRVSDDLRQHMRTHTNVRPHKCSQCERSFKHPQDLKIHLRSHTGERPYVCAVCGDSFQRYNTLRAHRIRMKHVENNNLVQNYDNKKFDNF